MPTAVPHACDVAILGGGPAGTATALGLLHRGVRRVVVVESSAYDSFRVGETVPPALPAILAQVDAAALLTAQAHRPPDGVCSAWGSDKLDFIDSMTQPLGCGWRLDRSRFDADLAQLAASRGALFVTRARWRGCRRNAAGGWSWSVEDAAGAVRSFETRFAVDASGRRAALAAALGARKFRLDRLAAALAVFPTPRDAAADAFLWLESVSYGWWYAVHLPCNHSLAVLMTDGDLLAGLKLAERAEWLQHLARTRHVRGFAKAAEQAMQVRVYPAMTQVLDRVAGAGWLAVGDAACAFDPLSSAGITKAIQSGLAAAESIGAALAGDGRAVPLYEQCVRQEFADYWQQRTAFYASEQRWPQEPFWRRRLMSSAMYPSQFSAKLPPPEKTESRR